MNRCVQCGERIPDNQTVCSMCYGDIDYGRDGYYRQWADMLVSKLMQELDGEEPKKDVSDGLYS